MGRFTRFTYEMLIELRPALLEAVMVQGVMPDVDKLIGYEFRGFNISPLTSVLGFQKFKKGFYRDGDVVWGYNVVVKQNRADEPHIALPSEENPKRHSWFKVYPAVQDPKDNRYKNALLLNYGNSKNILNPARVLRDYLVKVAPDNDDLYLGKAYFALGPLRLPGSFFILERYNRSTFSF